MLAVVGTVPDPDFPLTVGKVDMVENRSQIDFHAIVFHYLQPDVDWHNRILFMLNDLGGKPVLIADAGFMYAAKMSGQAQSYDLFTPDVGELAFLADETAPHPFYTRGFILHDNNKIPDLISRAYLHGNAAKNLLVKGATGYIADKDSVIFSVDNPIVEAMEAMGGTGDTITGIVTALAGTGIPIPIAAKIAAKVNRLAGFNTKPTPAIQVCEFISHISRALETVLKGYNVQ